MDAIIAIDKAGRIVVPKKMRDAMHIHPGDLLSAQVEGETMTIAHRRSGKGVYEKDGWLVYDSGIPISVEESLRLVDDAREERDAYLLGLATKK